MVCTVELLSIGNELLLGNTINTNASWIATQVTTNGATVTRITTVADNLREICRAVREALSRHPNYIITTGGIGPTFDDMTLEAVAKSLRQQLRLDPKAVAMIRQHYLRRFPGKTIRLTKPRLKMARTPARAVAIRNPVGTAPAVRIPAGNTEIYCLPGVPQEAKAIFSESIADSIQAKAGGQKFLERWIRVKGIMESSLAPAIDHTIERWPQVYIKSHPRGFEQDSPQIDVHISTSSANADRDKKILVSAVADFQRRLLALKLGKRRRNFRSDPRPRNHLRSVRT